MKLVSLGILARNVENLALRVKLNSSGQARLEFVGSLMELLGLSGM